MPPSEIQDLLLEVLYLPPLSKMDGTDPEIGRQKLTPKQRRQLDGCLNRVPRKFYDSFWNVLHRCPKGIKIAGELLPQLPTVSDMTLYELNFALKIDALLDRILHPAYRQVVVELVMVVNTVLERNPELYFMEPLDTDRFVHAAFERFVRDCVKKQEKEDNLKVPSESADGKSVTFKPESGDQKKNPQLLDIDVFYQQPPSITGMYLAGAVVDLLLHQDAEYSVAGVIDEACSIA